MATWGILHPVWLAQDWLRRLLNRWLYCSRGGHRGNPCKDCGR
jgi:hypothetical protein